jgi:hypothetical protein
LSNRKRPGQQRHRNGKTADGKVVATMAASGHVEDEIAHAIGVGKTVLRARHIGSLKSGRQAARTSAAAACAVSMEEYHFLDAATSSFASQWFDPERGNLLYPGGPDGDAKTVLDAFARWKERGGRYICTGLSNRFNLRKLAEFSKIVASYKQRQVFEDDKPC